MAAINQPTPNPTNKLTASVVAVAIIELARVLAANFFPGFNDAGLWTALAPVAVFLVGYFIKDDANVVLAVPVGQVDTSSVTITPVDYADAPVSPKPD